MIKMLLPSFILEFADSMSSTARAFHVNEDDALPEELLDLATTVPREDLFIMTTFVKGRPWKGLITETPLKYYDLVLLSSEGIYDEATLRREWRHLSWLVEAKALGVDNFYRNHLVTLLDLITETGLPSPNACALTIHQYYKESPEFISFISEADIPIIAKVPSGLLTKETLEYLLTTPISSILSSDATINRATVGDGILQEAFDLNTEIAKLNDAQWRAPL